MPHGEGDKAAVHVTTEEADAAALLRREVLYFQSGETMPDLLFGTEYTLPRKEFQESTPKKQPKTVQKVIVSTGGADAEHIVI